MSTPTKPHLARKQNFEAKSGPREGIRVMATNSVIPNPRNARTHSKKQIRQIADSIRAFGFNNPILVDDRGQVIAGHGRLLAARLLGIEEVPVLSLSHLSEAEARAYVLADNKIALNAGWDAELLSAELGDLADLLTEIELGLEITGFQTAEIDLLFSDHQEPDRSLDSTDLPRNVPDVPTTQPGDVWQLGAHQVLCGDARNRKAVAALFDGRSASLILTDPPYNVKIQGHAGGRGKTKHREFAFASGEMSDGEFGDFLRDSLGGAASRARPGALFYVFMDWRHIEILLAVGRGLDLALKNICVWNKTPPGQGSFYRSAHELVAVFAQGGGPAMNNIQLGKFGRNRSNVWTYPAVNTFQTDPSAAFALHPTVKPLEMILEAIKDASKRRDIIFDPFLGSGTTLLAAERAGRCCLGIEYEPGFVDVAVRRWQAMTGQDAVLLCQVIDEQVVEMDSTVTFDDRCASTLEAGQ